ncbi:hypothetical protein HALLA_08580 [Halostagnicola larsenii XH-48]|uniref:Uncharacterized protein n=1 Tax=Halostagnicola larsenii XH-48 TaxID=797299 RepID=W0JQF1_9EURY|nr:hypothetical protein HALLA_08580 [Halostagnicola larsenii XH-48]
MPTHALTDSLEVVPLEEGISRSVRDAHLEGF